jgi:ubiquinone/menaquinone biosynthesis C-methylase UbiE/uncharacterized protein YbaR (Trm112 family)
MFAEDIKFLCCPLTKEFLIINQVLKTDIDGEILEGELKSISSAKIYPITNGIPRFVFNKQYNATWDYKWTQIDKGQGLNYRITNKLDSAYQIHDLFDRNSHGGAAYQHARGKLALDIGCGVGQYSYRLLEEFNPAKLISMDLTGGVDIFRKLMLERFPHHKLKLLLVQANVFEMPFPDETFDYVFSLGVLHHTGNTLEAIRQASRVLKSGGHINFWIYASDTVPFSAREPNRVSVRSFREWVNLFLQYGMIKMWMRLFRKISHRYVVRIVKLFSSGFWYKLNTAKIPVLSGVARFLFGTVNHPDPEYRFINNYDGWVNAWDETWNEQELFPVLRESKIAIQGISDWRLGIWGTKSPDYYIEN